ncbi:hypothetical protein DQG13_06870 [Paenibacillus sp. YN15]|nr:hypothetical protein DQG13_06870 [Paenibacillus sp. YN15]
MQPSALFCDMIFLEARSSVEKRAGVSYNWTQSMRRLFSLRGRVGVFLRSSALLRMFRLRNDMVYYKQARERME